MTSFKTTDIFRGAFYLCMGGNLSGIRFKESDKQIAIFHFNGPDLSRHDQALFYTGRHSLKHKILAIEELDGMNGAIYAIRSIQSAKQVSIAYTGKDAATGEQKTLENVVEGPLMVFITNTAVDIDGETASRFMFISVDESEAMTRKILDKQRQSHTMTKGPGLEILV